MSRRVRVCLLVTVGLFVACADFSHVPPPPPSFEQWRFWLGIVVLAHPFLLSWAVLGMAREKGDQAGPAVAVGIFAMTLFTMTLSASATYGVAHTKLGEWAFRFLSWVHGWGTVGDAALVLLSIVGGLSDSSAQLMSFVAMTWVYQSEPLSMFWVAPGAAASSVVLLLSGTGNHFFYMARRRRRIEEQAEEAPSTNPAA